MGHVENFSKTAFGSSIFIIIVSPATILANILLLVTFFCFQHPSRRNCAPQLEFAAYFPAFPVSISASIVFAFTLTQYIVVASPLKYGRMITKKKAFVGIQLPRHQEDSPPANSPPRNDLDTNVLATKRSLPATNHQY